MARSSLDPLAASQFDSPAQFRRWLKSHHTEAAEIVVAFYRILLRRGLTYAEALDEALCFGWIDGIRKKLDESRYTIRFTPRKIGSIWSLINVGHITRLTEAGRMQPAGIAAFAARQENRTGIYSFENPPAKFSSDDEKEFRSHPRAWKFFAQQAPWYRRLATHRVVSPKQEATRQRRLKKLIAESDAGRRLP